MKKMRKLLALIMVFALVISMTSISASASDNIACEGKEICEHDYSEGSGEDTLADLYAEDEEVSDDTESTAEDAEADTTSVAEQDESIDETSEAEEIAEGNADDVSLVPDGAASSSDEDNNFPDAISNEEESEVGGNETALINYISEAERLLTDSSEEEGTSSYDANGPCLDSCDVLIEGELCYSLAFEALELINEIRVSAGVSSLVMDPTVLDFAMVRATETALYCAHNRPNGAGYTYGCSMADQENIHYGSGNLGSPEAAVSSWVNSIGHYSNMLAEDYKSTGIGVFKVNGQYFWVQVFSKDDGSEVYATNYSDAFISTTVNIADYRITDKISAYVVDSYLEVGETEQVEVWFEETDLCVCYYELPPNGMNYTSSDESVVTVSASGVATAVGEGTATISATYPGYDLDPWKFDITVCNHDAGYTSVVTTDPTCDEEGLRTYTCEDCGDSYTETIDALGHTWDDGEITEASTCVDQGTCLYTCETCGDTKTGIVVPTYQHIYDNGVVTTEPTCGE